MMAEGHQRATVYTIPPDIPFLKTLVSGILSGEILPTGYDLSEPFALADISIYLPTQRSVRLLEEVFREMVPAKSTLLPRIRALGDVDEDEALFDDLERPAGDVPPALSSLTRQLILTRFIEQWGRAMAGQDTAVRTGDQPLLVPASAADAAWLAADLGDLLDRATTEGIDWYGLKDLVRREELARFWQLSLDFLKIVTEQWPALLEERGYVDQATRRDLLIAAERERLGALKGPVIAAGSTGTLPSTAKFLATVARHPAGALVLPGFDHEMNDAIYEVLGGKAQGVDAISGHPQYGLKQLLSDYVKITPDGVDVLGERDACLKQRIEIVMQAMLPAPATSEWASYRAHLTTEKVEQAFQDVAFIKAKNDAEEALAIACVLRKYVEDAKTFACLVTPDRALARRVTLELKRWGLEVDDSAGRPLSKTAPAILSQLIIDAVSQDFEPVTLLALLKHPLAHFGLDVGLVRRAARVLDLAVLRGPRISGGTRGLARRLQQVTDDVLRGTALSTDVTAGEPVEQADEQQERVKSRNRGRLHPAIAGYSDADWEAAKTLVERLRQMFDPLETLFQQGDALTLATLSTAHHQALLSTADLPASPASLALARHFDETTKEDASAFLVHPRDYAKLFRALLGSGTVREGGVEDPRILVLGALEARLLAPELIILAGLDEGAWPKQAETDAFLSRGMRADMDMEAPERRIGLAAHDICQGLGTPRVVLSRAAKRGGSPTVMSRWLQRLTALLGDEQSEQLERRGAAFLAHARLLDKKTQKIGQRAMRPNPKPPVAARPSGLSVTRVETWVRDPYAIYADRVLGLKQIDDLGAIPSFADRGTIIHEALDRFNKVWDGVVNEEALATLNRIGSEIFDEAMTDFPDQRALWWPRFERIAKAYLGWEEVRDPEATGRYSEVYAKLPIVVEGSVFTLSGTIDRIDELADGSLAIIDFKTGEPPSAKQVKSGLSSQLALEVVMQKRGAFDFIAPFSDKAVSELGWIKLDGREERAKLKTAIQSVKKGEVPDTPDDLGELAEAQLIGLIRRYQDPEQGYMSRPRPDFDFRYEGAYDHLARVKEWQLADDED